MKRNYYGSEDTGLWIDQEEYPGIHTPQDLYDALSHVWCRYTCTPRMRKDYETSHMTLGQCAITAFLAQDIFGGDVCGIPLEEGGYHCFNVVEDHVFDITSEQFREKLNYENTIPQSREIHFQRKEKEERYQYLKKQLKQYCMNGGKRMRYLALDFGGTFVKHCLMDDNAEISERGQINAPLGSIDDFTGVITDLYEKYRDEVKGIAISMPGVIDSDSGYLQSGGAYTQIVAGKNLFDLLRDKVDVPVAVENDAKSAILAEAWKGSLQGVSDAAAIIIGSGLGGGVIMDGKLRKGAHFASGEISGLLVQPGNYGMENFAAANAATTALLMMVANAKGLAPAQFEISAFMAQGEPDPNLPIYTGKDVFRWIDEGDPVTCAVYEKWLANLAQVIINLKMVIDPQKIVIGGGVSRNPRLLNDIKAEYSKLTPMMKAFGMPETELDVCTFSADANMVGAVYNWLLHHEN